MNVTVIINGEQHEGELINGFVYLGKRRVTYGHSTGTGKSIREEMWDELDNAMDLLMQGPPEKWTDDRDPNPQKPAEIGIAEDWRLYGHEQGVASATAYIISLFENPIHPDIDSVKAAAVTRFKERQELLQLKTPEEVANNAEDDSDVDVSVDAESATDGASRAGQTREG